MALGVALENPLLVAGGMTKIASGLCRLAALLLVVNQLISRVVPSLLAGGGGAMAAAVRMALQWRSTTPFEKAGIVAEGLSVGSLLALLSGYSLWASTPLGASIGLGTRVLFAQAENKYWSRLPLTSRFADQLALETIERHGGAAAVRAFEQYLLSRPKLEQTPNLKSFLESEPRLADEPLFRRSPFHADGSGRYACSRPKKDKGRVRSRQNANPSKPTQYKPNRLTESAAESRDHHCRD